MIDKNFLDNLEYAVTGACIEVHKAIGPGLLERIYHKCLMQELKLRNINFTSEQIIAVSYKGIDLDTDLRADFLIEGCMVLEIKSIEKILPVHQAQLLTYMRILEAPVGSLINFNCTNIIKYGKTPLVNEFYRKLAR